MVKEFLRRNALAVVFATILAIMLGVITACLAVLIGPSIELLLRVGGAPSTQIISLEELFGKNLSAMFRFFGMRESIELEWYFQLLPIFLIGVASLKAVLTSAHWFIWERLGERLSRQMRSELMNSYIKLDPQALLTQSGLDEGIAAALSSDIRSLREYLIRFFGGLPREGAQVVFLFVTLFLLSPKLLAIFVFGVVPFIAGLRLLGRSLKRRAGRSLREFSEMTEFLQQRLLGIETIKHARTEDVELSAMKEKNEMLFRAMYRAESMKALTGPLLESGAILGLGIVFAISLRQIYSGETSAAIQLSFFSSLALLGQAGAKLGKYFNSQKEASAALSRLSGLEKNLANNTLNSVGLRLRQEANAPLRIECRNLNFRYSETHEGGIQDFSFKFEAGKFYCIAGPSGSGKSTLLRMLLGVLRPQSGSITLSGAHSVRVGYLSQSHKLLGASLGENISFPDSDFDPARVDEVLKKVGLEKLNAGNGLSHATILGSDGKRLSGGQEQRLHLARILYHRYELVFVDEGTSALDPKNEEIIYKNFRDLCKSGSMVIMVSHRPRSFDFADQVIQLSAGRLNS